MMAKHALVLAFTLCFVRQVTCDCLSECESDWSCSECADGRTKCTFPFSGASRGECANSCPTECRSNSDCFQCGGSRTVCSFWKSECKTEAEAKKDDEASSDAAEAAGTAIGVTFLVLVIGGPILGIAICICVCIFCCRREQTVVIQQQPQAFPANQASQGYAVNVNALPQPGPNVPMGLPANAPNASPAAFKA
mmetsp:Transcript_43414/g.31227  ORF Transcript_43414/g.31227 Transcript_43414/m.31227 type:complete len:194 (+) Transcript_43414:196-777(+)